MADHANHAAAVAAGYVRIDLDRGAGKSPRYSSTYEKHMVGEAGYTGAELRATADHDTQATAQANALAALNKQRAHRHGRSGMTDDVS